MFRHLVWFENICPLDTTLEVESIVMVSSAWFCRVNRRARICQMFEEPLKSQLNNISSLV